MKLNDILSRPITERIQHIEDLHISEFLSVVSSLDKYIITEKIDGSNIHFGLDYSGFYTSREDKGGSRIYNAHDYPVAFNTTYLRAAHLALSQKLDKLKEHGLSFGHRVEAEVLFGKLPNVIRYTDDLNHIVMLRTLEGNLDVHSLQNELLNETVTITLETPYSLDGKKMLTDEKDYRFCFSTVPVIEHDEICRSLSNSLQDDISKINYLMEQKSGILGLSNYDVLNHPLNKRHDSVEKGKWQYYKTLIKEHRDKINCLLYDEDGYCANIKEHLLNSLVRNTSSRFGPSSEDGGWIEGIVFKNRDTGKQVKLVDKKTFTSVKDFLWEVRASLSEKPKSLDTVNSFIGKLMVEMSQAIGMPKLGTTQCKRILKQLGDTTTQIVEEISKNIDFHSVKHYWLNLLTEHEEQLGLVLDEYITNKHERYIEIQHGSQLREFKYDDEINHRTLQVFSEMFYKIKDLRESIKICNTSHDLIWALYKDQLV